MFKLIIDVLRVKQWVKNSFIFIPGFFSGTIFQPDHLIQLILTFLSFSMTTSAIYILNDIRDREMDRLHPIKKNRPFASNRITPNQGIIIMLLNLSIGLSTAYFLAPSFLILSLGYMTLNIAYSMGLKSISIIDLLIVSFGFIIRVYIGGIVSDVYVSHWLVIMIFLLSLFIVLTKRSDDIRIFEEEGTIVRKTSAKYNQSFINACITMISGIIIVSYILYCVSPEITNQWGSDYIFVTTIFVIAGIMRYLQLTLVERNSGSPVEILYKDKFIIITLILWVSSFGIIIYL